MDELEPKKKQTNRVYPRKITRLKHPTRMEIKNKEALKLIRALRAKFENL